MSAKERYREIKIIVQYEACPWLIGQVLPKAPRKVEKIKQKDTLLSVSSFSFLEKYQA